VQQIRQSRQKSVQTSLNAVQTRFRVGQSCCEFTNLKLKWFDILAGNLRLTYGFGALVAFLAKFFNFYLLRLTAGLKLQILLSIQDDTASRKISSDAVQIITQQFRIQHG